MGSTGNTTILTNKNCSSVECIFGDLVADAMRSLVADDDVDSGGVPTLAIVTSNTMVGVIPKGQINSFYYYS